MSAGGGDNKQTIDIFKRIKNEKKRKEEEEAASSLPGDSKSVASSSGPGDQQKQQKKKGLDAVDTNSGWDPRTRSKTSRYVDAVNKIKLSSADKVKVAVGEKKKPTPLSPNSLVAPLMDQPAPPHPNFDRIASNYRIPKKIPTPTVAGPTNFTTSQVDEWGDPIVNKNTAPSQIQTMNQNPEVDEWGDPIVKKAVAPPPAQRQQTVEVDEWGDPIKTGIPPPASTQQAAQANDEWGDPIVTKNPVPPRPTPSQSMNQAAAVDEWGDPIVPIVKNSAPTLVSQKPEVDDWGDPIVKKTAVPPTASIQKTAEVDDWGDPIVPVGVSSTSAPKTTTATADDDDWGPAPTPSSYSSWSGGNNNGSSYGGGDSNGGGGRGRGGRGGRGARGGGPRGPPREPREGDWNCACGANNFAGRRECFKCKEAKPGGVGGGSSNGGRERREPREGDWNCACGANNFQGRRECFKCKEAKPGGVGGGSSNGRERREPREGDWNCACGANNFAGRRECFKCKEPIPEGLVVASSYGGRGGGSGKRGRDGSSNPNYEPVSKRPKQDFDDWGSTASTPNSSAADDWGTPTTSFTQKLSSKVVVDDDDWENTPIKKPAAVINNSSQKPAVVKKVDEWGAPSMNHWQANMPVINKKPDEEDDWATTPIKKPAARNNMDDDWGSTPVKKPAARNNNMDDDWATTPIKKPAARNNMDDDWGSTSVKKPAARNNMDDDWGSTPVKKPAARNNMDDDWGSTPVKKPAARNARNHNMDDCGANSLSLDRNRTGRDDLGTYSSRVPRLNINSLTTDQTNSKFRHGYHTPSRIDWDAPVPSVFDRMSVGNSRSIKLEKESRPSSSAIQVDDPTMYSLPMTLNDRFKAITENPEIDIVCVKSYEQLDKVEVKRTVKLMRDEIVSAPTTRHTSKSWNSMRIIVTENGENRENIPKKDILEEDDGQKKKQTQCLGPGMRGFLLSTGFREADCIREGYSLLNEYYRPEDTLTDVGDEQDANKKPKDTDDAAPDKPENDLTNIDKALGEELNEIRNESLKFQSVDTGVKNILFISTTVPRPKDIVYRIFEDVFEKKETKSRNILRFIPIEGTCHVDGIRKFSKEIFTQYFEADHKSFKIIFNANYSKVSKDEIITALAEVVHEINPVNVVNLTDPEYTIIVEVIKSTILLSVLKDFAKFKEFNITELVSPTPVHIPGSSAKNQASMEPENSKPSESEDKMEIEKNTTQQNDEQKPILTDASNDQEGGGSLFQVPQM